MSIQLFEAQWAALLQDNPRSSLYLLVDSAQDERLPGALVKAVPGMRTRCLLNIAHGHDLERAAPHLVAMPPFDVGRAFWHAVFDKAAANPASQTLIASPLGFDVLYAHLHSYIDVRMPDDDEMILAFWDPVVLGTLVGQEDDATLHVPGPVLTAAQRAHLLHATTGWWYWGRGGKMHRIRPAPKPSVQLAPPLKLTQEQEDAVVEASVPDHLLSYLHDSRPQVLAAVPRAERYERIRCHLREARSLGLRGMSDLLDYICAALIQGENMKLDSTILELLMKVRTKEISLAQALEQFP